MHLGTFAVRPSIRGAGRIGTMRGVIAWLLAAALAMAPFAARGEDDLPGRVGRVAEFAGQVFLSPQDRATEWSAIGINYPVTTGDNLWVSADGRAEIDYGGGQFRLAGDTNLHLSRLDDQQLALFAAQGGLIVRVRVLDGGDEARIDTPNTQVRLTRPGLYRIDVAPDRQATTVTVREGEALIGLASGAQQALPGQTVVVTGPEPSFADVRSGIGIDGFDSWSADRDRRYERGRSTAYVSRQMVGYAELDEYGTWETSPTYGPVWYPTAVAEDWAPYRDGYWANVGGWGLTWVDAAPWGYAPSHYGRWVRVGPRWGWCPGAYVARPYWAPALVGWYGGAGWGVSVNLGAPVYGWVPLGWGDPYIPWWRGCSNNCWTHYNRPYAVNTRVRPKAPPARYSNLGVPGAMTVVRGAALGTREPVAANMVRVPRSGLASAPALASAPPVASGPLNAPALRPGERGAPPPASTLDSRSGRGRETALPPPRTGGTSAATPAAGGPAVRPLGSTPGAASTPAPTIRPGAVPPVAQPAPARAGSDASRPPGSAGTPPAVAPGPAARKSAPPPATPAAGGTVVAAPPARAGAQPSPQQPRASGVAGQGAATSAPPSGGGRASGPTATGTGAAGVPMPAPRPAPATPPSGASPGAAGIPIPASRPAPAPAPSGAGSRATGVPMPPSHPAPAAAPTPSPTPAPMGRAAPAPAPTGRASAPPAAPVAAPAAPGAPSPQQQRPQAKPAEGAPAQGAKGTDKGNP